MAEEARAKNKEYRPVFSSLDPSERNERDRIKLRRSVGKGIEEADSGALAAFYGNVRCAKEDEHKAFFIAGLYCMQGKNGSMRLPEAWGRYINEKGGRGDRLLRMLDTSWSKTTEIEIIRAFRILIGSGYSIDLEWLYRDIRNWDSFETRKRWAIAYSIATGKQEEKEND